MEIDEGDNAERCSHHERRRNRERQPAVEANGKERHAHHYQRCQRHCEAGKAI